MKPDRNHLDDLTGASVYVRIHDNLGSGIELVKDAKDGYLYRGSFLGRVLFEDGDSEEHFAIALTRSILYRQRDGERRSLNQILAATRYKGDSMIEVLEGKVITASFSTLSDLQSRMPVAPDVGRYKKDVFDSDRFIWIGIGELGMGDPASPYTERPWDMEESSDRNE